MAQDATPAFLAGSHGHLRCYDLSDAAEPMLAIGVMMVGLFAVLRLRPFRNDNQSAFISVRIAAANRARDLLPFERNFRQKDDISPPTMPPKSAIHPA